MLFGHKVNDLGLQCVRVLIFVNEDVLELILIDRGDVGLLDHQPLPVDEQVVVIHRVAFELARLIKPVNAFDLLCERLEVRVFRRDDLFERRVGVRGEAEHIGQDFAFRKTPRASVNRGLVNTGVKQIFGVFGIEDRIVVLVAQADGVAAQDAIGDRMKGSAPDAAHVLTEQRFDASEHFTRGAVGERDEHDPPGRDTGLDQPRDAICHRARLARTRSGDDQNGARARADNRALLFVQSFAVIDERRARRIGFDDELSRHWCWGGGGSGWDSSPTPHSHSPLSLHAV